MKVTLLNLESPDSKHPRNTLAIATVAFTFDSGESVIVNDYRLIQNSKPGPNWVAPPTRFSADGKPIPLIITTRKVLREVEDLVMAAWQKQQDAALEAAVKQSPADNAQQEGAR
jgi:hypothetical protein